MSFDTPLAKVRGLGSAKYGTKHFIFQRVTAIALVFLLLWLLYSMVCCMGSGYADVRTFIAQPIHAALLLMLCIALFWHAMLGIQVVIEDYVHTAWLEMSLQVLNKFYALAAMVVAALSITRIALGA